MAVHWWALFVALAAGARAQTQDQKPRVLITGATGRLGSLLYAQAKADERIGAVSALVTNLTLAREYLNCSACDASEGIYLGDVTEPDTLAPAVEDVDSVLIAVGASPDDSADQQKAVEVTGVENQMNALFAARNARTAPADRQVVLCSSMGTTEPDPSPTAGGSILFLKLNAEAILGGAGLKTVIVKPCGLSLKPAGEKELLVGHDDTLLSTMPPVIPRADVARVMIEAAARGESKMRFDLCAKLVGPPTTDAGALLDAAKYP